MNAEVPDLSDEPTEIQMNYPDREWWNTDQDQKKNERRTELKRSLTTADVIGIVDSDSDGLACEVVLQDRFEDEHVEVIQASGEYGISLHDACDMLRTHADESSLVVVADLAPDADYSSYLASLSKIPGETHVYDHHDWAQFAKESIENEVDNLTIGGDECAAQVLQRELHPEADEQLEEYLEVTADHDLWRKEDPRSDHLSTLSFVLDRDRFVSAALEHGADMVEKSDEFGQIYEQQEQKAEERSRIAQDRADWVTHDGNDIAVTYGDCHQSRVGDALLENGADLAVIIQPTLKVSFRSKEDNPICSDLAKELKGGGHPTAAGAKLYHHIDVPDSENKFEYVWETEGRPALDFIHTFLERNL